MAKKKEESLGIQPIVLGNLVMTLKGETPYIANAYAMKEGTGKRPKSLPIEEQINFDEDGDYAIKSSAIKKAVVSGGGRFAGEKMTVLRGAIQIPQTYIKLVAPQGYEEVMFAITNNTAGKKKVEAARPVFYEWETAPFKVQYLKSALTREDVMNLFFHAGFAVGIGAWRPECNGQYGMFTLTRCDELPDDALTFQSDSTGA